MSGDDRQSELAQQHKERQAQRAAEERKAAARTRRNVTIGVGLGVVLVVGGVIAATGALGGAGDPEPAAAASATPTPSASAPTVAPSNPLKPSEIKCDYRPDESGSPAKKVGTPPSKPNLGWKTMTLVTNQGDVVIDLATQAAPCTVNSFAFLAKKNFYDDTRCFRLATPENSGLALLQCGDPFAKGDGKNAKDGAGSSGYLFNDENLGGMSYDRGTVFMAQGGEDANSNGSQFAISFASDTTQLDVQPAYTPFGKVSKGLDVIDKIVAGGTINNPADVQGTGGSSAPKLPVIIKDMKLSK